MIELSAAADKLLEELKTKGVKLALTGEKLRVQGELSDELKKQVLENKKGLIQLVKLGEHRWRSQDATGHGSSGQASTGQGKSSCG